MTLIKRILLPENRVNPVFKQFCAHLQDTGVGRDSDEFEFEAMIMEAIVKLENQWIFDSQDKQGYPAAQRTLNVGRKEMMLAALTERYPEDKDEAEEE